MPEGAHFYLDDVNIPNSWYSIEQGMNSKLYFRYLHAYDQIGYRDIIIDVPSEIYNGDSFIAVVKTLLNAETGSFFNVVYDPNRNCMNISSTNLICFQIFTDEELIDPATDFGVNSNLPGQPRLFTADKNNLASMNQVIKN